MANRIRKVKIASGCGGETEEAFIYNETDEYYEVLLASQDEFTVLFFDKSTLTDGGGQHLLFILPEFL